jgi:hypothetical protein
MGSSKKIFISYVEEDGAVAHEIAAGLESQGYSSWYYERDCPAGADYFEETYKAISDCEAMVVLISPRSLPSDQVTREIVRAVESCKATLPLLLEISHDDYARRRPGWKQAMAAANATRIPLDRIPTIIPALVAGLSAKGIQAETNGHASPVATTKGDTQTRGTARTPVPHTATTPVSAVATPPSSVPSTAKVETFAPAAATTTTQISPTPAAATTQTQQLPWKAIAIAAAAVIVAASAWAVVRARKPKPPVVPPAPATATIVLQYASDRHKCTPDLNVTIAGTPYHPTSNPYAASGVKIGAQEYAIDGLINCPGRKAIKTSGTGAIDVHEGAVFDFAWQAKPGGGSTVDIISVDAANTSSNGDNSDSSSQDSSQKSVAHAVKPAPAPAPVPVPVPVPTPVDAGQQMFLNAQTAYTQGRYFVPINASALHWAILSRNAGNQNGKALEGQLINIYKTQVTQLFTQQNYPAALQLNAAMQSYYPGDSGLLQDQQKILAAASGRAGGYQAPVNGQVPVAPYPPGYPPQYQPRPVPHTTTPHP